MPACQEIRFSPENQVIIFWSSVFKLLLHHSGIMTLRSFMKLLTSVFDIEFSSQLHYKVLTRKKFLESVFFSPSIWCVNIWQLSLSFSWELWRSFPNTLPTQMVHACSCVCVWSVGQSYLGVIGRHTHTLPYYLTFQCSAWWAGKN